MDTQAILSDLARAKAVFQQRAVVTHLTGQVLPAFATMRRDGETVPLRFIPLQHREEPSR